MNKVFVTLVSTIALILTACGSDDSGVEDSAAAASDATTSTSEAATPESSVDVEVLTADLKTDAEALIADFQSEVAALGLEADDVPLTVKSSPQLIFFDGGVTIPQWETLDPQLVTLFESWAANSNGVFTAEEFFKRTFNWFFIPHEMGHWIQHKTETPPATLYEGELEANEIAIAYWKINHRAELDDYIALVEQVVQTLPAPEDTSVEFFEANYQALGADPAAYGYFQFWWILEAYKNVDTLELANFVN